MGISLKARLNGLDPRTKLLFVVFIGNAAFMAPGNWALCWCFAVALAVILIAGEYKGAVTSGLVFLVAMGLDTLATRYLQEDILGLTAGMFSFMLARLAPIFMMAGWALNTTGASHVIAAMQNMRSPKGFTIAIAVTFRFVPTVRYEFRHIKNTMKLRGVGLSWRRILCHPLQTLEYSIVPLLMRSIKISDDLAASALTRGLGRPVRRSSIWEVRLRSFDWVSMALCISVILAGFTILAQ